MKKQALLYSVLLMLSYSCVEPEVLEEEACAEGEVCTSDNGGDNPPGGGNMPPGGGNNPPGGGNNNPPVDVPEEDTTPPDVVVEASGNMAVPLAAKNYLQLNNTYSSLTGIATSNQNVLNEFNAIIMQLPTTSNPEALNGFNQIAQARLAFAYCDEYIDDNFNSYSGLQDGPAMRMLLDNMIDVDVDNNTAHAALYQNLMDIMNDADQLVVDGNATSKRRKLMKMSCASLLASSYVSML